LDSSFSSLQFCSIDPLLPRKRNIGGIRSSLSQKLKEIRGEEKMLRIHVPAPLQIKEGRARPFYCTETSEYLDLVDLSVLTLDQAEMTGHCIKVMAEYEDQPVLIVTSKGSYFIQSDPLRFNDAPLVAIESPILGVYPLYRLVDYKRPFNKRILNKLRWLVCKKKSIFELEHSDDS
jgi:hypothetical protein